MHVINFMCVNDDKLCKLSLSGSDHHLIGKILDPKTEMSNLPYKDTDRGLLLGLVKLVVFLTLLDILYPIHL